MITAALLAFAVPETASAQSPGPSACAGSSLVPAIGATAPVAQAVLCLINQQRATAGLPALNDAPLLDAAAGAYAAQMVAQDFFDHTAPDGTTFASRIAATGYAFTSAGENIGYGSGLDTTAAAMVAAWMGSAPHRANILEPSFGDLGVGVAPAAPGGGAGATYVADFGSRSGSGSGSGSGSATAASTAVHRPRLRCTRRRARRHLCRLPRHRTTA
jgi:uncharacterized protein YkwD